MFDFSWGDGGITVYWPGSTPATYPPGTYPPGTYPTPYPTGNTTQISTGTLLVIALLAYVLLTRK
jgi:hypothetical protein